jgi:hypothetical protein
MWHKNSPILREGREGYTFAKDLDCNRNFDINSHLAWTHLQAVEVADDAARLWRALVTAAAEPTGK